MLLKILCSVRISSAAWKLPSTRPRYLCQETSSQKRWVWGPSVSRYLTQKELMLSCYDQNSIMYSLVFDVFIGFEALQYLQALLSYNSDIQANLLNSEIRRVVHRNLKKWRTPSSCPPGLRPGPTSFDTAMSFVAFVLCDRQFSPNT